MSLVFDTEVLESQDLAEGFADAIQRNSAPSYVALGNTPADLRARIEAWEFGVANLVRVRMSPHADAHWVRTSKQVRVSPAAELAIHLYGPCSIGHYRQTDIHREVAAGDLYLMDHNLPYEMDWSGSDTVALLVPVELLGLPTETIRSAADRPQASPLYSLVAKHIALMIDSAEAIQSDPAAREWGESCVEMMRALIISAAAARGDGAALSANTLLTEIRDYVRRHCADPDLDAPAIARAHNISVRYLYKLCAQANASLEQWIIEHRLHRARRELANPRYRHRSIAMVAYRTGFRDPSHFTRRFRAAFGVTPREWRDSMYETD